MSFYFSFIFLDNTSHKFWDQSPSHPFSIFFLLDSFLSQTLVLLLCQYTATLSSRSGMIFFVKVNHSRISRNISRNWLVSIIYERYCHKIWECYVNKIGNYLVFRQFLKNIWGTYNMPKCRDTWIMLFQKLRRMGGSN